MIYKKKITNYFRDENNKRYKVVTTKFIFEPEFLFKTRHFLKFILKMKELSHCIKYMDLKSIHTK